MLQKIENIQYLHDFFESGYSELLRKSDKTTMITPRLKFLCTEIYKTLNQLNPRFMSNIFKLSSSNRAARKQQVLNLETIRPNQVNFDEKSLRALCPKMWNNFPRHIKSAGNLSTFKNLIKSWRCNAKTLRSEELASWVFILFIHKHDFTFCKSGNKSENKWVIQFSDIFRG